MSWHIVHTMCVTGIGRPSIAMTPEWWAYHVEYLSRSSWSHIFTDTHTHNKKANGTMVSLIRRLTIFIWNNLRVFFSNIEVARLNNYNSRSIFLFAAIVCLFTLNANWMLRLQHLKPHRSDERLNYNQPTIVCLSFARVYCANPNNRVKQETTVE